MLLGTYPLKTLPRSVPILKFTLTSIVCLWCNLFDFDDKLTVCSHSQAIFLLDTLRVILQNGDINLEQTPYSLTSSQLLLLLKFPSSWVFWSLEVSSLWIMALLTLKLMLYFMLLQLTVSLSLLLMFNTFMSDSSLTVIIVQNGTWIHCLPFFSLY